MWFFERSKDDLISFLVHFLLVVSYLYYFKAVISFLSTLFTMMSVLRMDNKLGYIVRSLSSVLNIIHL
ncbi:uncharacterized protein TOT_040000051 [Theileria orientalis strain Shintoku]|uniref:VPS9 domain-containing protein n=1 Tax=Theileria orientalis strain Shintoku TaxID=869250 RepID=J4D9Y3_THEOR|nr:uncharacterized protein TOT_040000051 [Theileria orientalis strain Shintoku]BAM41670.1 uncharacterized protein TOT_040000051 [Theileria orientalis strain Shintoku]|eukprot:XP_009691971.1 uncharacterized protein TOT_040000051 [Theileria orientalis strain Shintoku]